VIEIEQSCQGTNATRKS